MNQQRRLKSPQYQKSAKLMTVFVVIILLLFSAVMMHALDLR
jgi:hypothetical protein